MIGWVSFKSVKLICFYYCMLLLGFYCLVDVFVVGEERKFSSTMLNLTLCCLLCFDGGV